MDEIIEQFVNGNVSHSCEEIEKYGAYNFFDGLQVASISINLYVRMTLAYIFYAENK